MSLKTLILAVSHIHDNRRTGSRFIIFPDILRSKLFLTLKIVVLIIKIVLCVKIDGVETSVPWRYFIAIGVVEMLIQGDDFVALLRFAGLLLVLDGLPHQADGVVLGLLVVFELLQDGMLK